MKDLSDNEKELILKFVKELGFTPHKTESLVDSKVNYQPFYCVELDQFIYIGAVPQHHFDRHTGSITATGTPAKYKVFIGSNELAPLSVISRNNRFPEHYLSLEAHYLEEIQNLLRQMFYSSFEENETSESKNREQRIGQNDFRDDLLNYWGGCAVTELREPKLLRAAHIKPWRDSSDKERLDLYNGLLLSANLDAAFDAGLISFDHYGKIIISNNFSVEQMKLAGIHSDMALGKIDERHKPYLVYHRMSFKENLY